ncbi:MAG: UDP-glucose 6-dehydrogenase, partial [Proteobacteria bacterium]|nr:UDP-glucose 6-dehydrogenase [Pseudomonadota bacterium]
LAVIKALSERGAAIRAYDPVAKTEAQKQLGETASLEFFDDLYDAVDQSDALLLLTEWKEFRAPDFHRLEQKLISKVIFDGRNVFDPKVVAMHNLSYYSIGRRPVLVESQ